MVPSSVSSPGAATALVPGRVDSVGDRWTSAQILILAAVLVIAAALRAILLPTEGLRFDLDVFARWAHEIATRPLGEAYRGDINLPPVMVYVWGALGALQPAFKTAMDASDATIRVFLKAPASLADLALALAAAWSMRDRPAWAIAGAAAIGLHPVLIDDSAWWGQYESLYALPAFIAFLLARAGRPVPSAVALGITLMTKPQAFLLIVPFAAFALRRLSARQLAIAVAAFLLTVIVLWSPFLLDNGPANYLRTLTGIQNGSFAAITIGAWNLWWIIGQVLPSGSDAVAILGPLNAREIGLGLAVFGEIAVFIAVWREPTARRLALGLVCATLVGFSLLTTMHERYSFAALIFLVPLLPDRRFFALWTVLSLAITANMFLIVQLYEPNPATAGLIVRIGVLDAAAMLAATSVSLWLLIRDSPPQATPRILSSPQPR